MFSRLYVSTALSAYASVFVLAAVLALVAWVNAPRAFGESYDLRQAADAVEPG